MASLTSSKRDRTGKKTVALVGMAQTSRHAAPFNDYEVDIWVLNESHAHNYLKRITRMFQLHPEWDYLRGNNFNDPHYPEFIKNLPWTEEEVKRLENMNTYKELPRGFPEVKVGNLRRPEDVEIVLIKPNDDIPGKKSLYPFKEIMDSYGNQKSVRYFTSSGPYMIALAIHEGYERIEVYGFEMSSATEYAYQKPCMEFWLGVALGKGLDIYVPPGCSLLGETTTLYGYDKVPGYTDMHAEIRKGSLLRERGKAEIKFNEVTAQLKRLQSEYQLAAQKKDAAWLNKVQKQLNQMQGTYANALAQLNSIHGAYLEAERVWKEINAMPSSEEIKPIVPMK